MLRLLNIVFLLTLADSSSARLYLGYSLNHFQYREPSVMKQHGPMQGLELGKFWRNSLGSLQIGGEYHFGHLTYEGSGLFDPTVSIKQRTPHQIWHFSGTQTFGPGKFRPRLGLAYRYWNDKNGPNYQRETSYLYLPIGIQIFLNFNLILNLDYYYFIRGQNESDLMGGIKLTQKNGYGLHANLTYFLNRNLYTKLRLTYWDIQDSELGPEVPNMPGSFFLEPENNTLHSSVVIGFLF